MRSLVLLALVVGCVDTPPVHEPVVESSHVEIKEWPANPPAKLDVLIFVDDTPATASYHAAVVGIPALVAARIEPLLREWGDVQIGVTANAGELRRLPSGARFITDGFAYDYTRHANYAGALADVLAPLADVGSGHAGPSQPLEAVRRALETQSELVRDDAALAILVVTGADDASPLAPDDYAQWTDRISRGGWSKLVVVAAIEPPSAPRLAAYFSATQTPSVQVPIDSADHAKAVAAIDAFATRWHGGVPCMESQPLLLDSERALYDCAMTATIGDAAVTVPQCDAEPIDARAEQRSLQPAAACWALRVDHLNCGWSGVDNGLTFQLSGYTNERHPAFRLECRTR